MTTAGIATIPERANLLPRVVGSIIRGFNLLSDEDRRLYAPTKLYLSFSGYPDDLYDEVATRCNQETFNAKFQCNLVFYRHDTRVECGDQGKFMAAKEPQSMIEGHWSFDDDLEYRPEYFQNMVEGIKRHRWAIITYHGRSFDVNSMFEGYLQGPFLNRVRALDDHVADVRVMFPGTGCMFVPWTFFRRFPSPYLLVNNMADVNVGLWMATEEPAPIEAWAVAHKKGDIIQLTHLDPGIYDTTKGNKFMQETRHELAQRTILAYRTGHTAHKQLFRSVAAPA